VNEIKQKVSRAANTDAANFKVAGNNRNGMRKGKVEDIRLCHTKRFAPLNGGLGRAGTKSQSDFGGLFKGRFAENDLALHP